jgi:hypothetical protein
VSAVERSNTIEQPGRLAREPVSLAQQPLLFGFSIAQEILVANGHRTRRVLGRQMQFVRHRANVPARTPGAIGSSA